MKILKLSKVTKKCIKNFKKTHSQCSSNHFGPKLNFENKRCRNFCQKSVIREFLWLIYRPEMAEIGRSQIQKVRLGPKSSQIVFLSQTDKNSWNYPKKLPPPNRSIWGGGGGNFFKCRLTGVSVKMQRENKQSLDSDQEYKTKFEPFRQKSEFSACLDLRDQKSQPTPVLWLSQIDMRRFEFYAFSG